MLHPQEQLLGLFVPVLPNFHQVLHHVDLIAPKFSQKILIKLSLLLPESTHLDEGHQRYNYVRQALH